MRPIASFVVALLARAGLGGGVGGGGGYPADPSGQAWRDGAATAGPPGDCGPGGRNRAIGGRALRIILRIYYQQHK